MSASVCSVIDNTFGPYAGGCRGGFDFTLLFEETILSLLPLCIILAVVPWRVLYLVRRTTKVDGTMLLPLKLVRMESFPCFQVHGLES